jgi:hypothetical protein
MRSTANRFVRVALVSGALALSFTLGGCGTFDPTDVFDFDFLSTKKKLPGERKPLFPEGTPGVAHGVPNELVKGYQAPAEQPPEQTASVPEPEKPKPKPKPKVVAKPPEQQQQQQQQSRPTSVTVRPGGTATANAAGTQWPDPPQAQAEAQPRQQPAQQRGGWPGSPAGGTQWPDPPQIR